MYTRILAFTLFMVETNRMRPYFASTRNLLHTFVYDHHGTQRTLKGSGAYVTPRLPTIGGGSSPSGGRNLNF